MKPLKSVFGKSKGLQSQKTKMVQNIFTEVTKKYDLMNNLMSFGFHNLWKQRLIELMNIQPNDCIVDIGSGTGDITNLIHQNYADVFITSLDLNFTILKYGKDKIIISIDFDKNGLVVTKGWIENSNKKAKEILVNMSDLNFNQFILTDTTRDGTLTQPNFDLIKSMRMLTPNKITIAGGISKTNHLTQLSNLGIDGAIVGTAIYTGDIDFKNAINIVSEPETKNDSNGAQ